MLDLLAFGNSRFELIAESVLRWLSCYFVLFRYKVNQKQKAHGLMGFSDFGCG